MRNYVSTTRNEYGGDDLDEKSVSPSPIKQFDAWMQHAVAKKIYDPNAMILATADRYGKPSARTVLLRDFSDKGFVFYTNYNSRKGKEIEVNPYASILFYWPDLQRQVRIDGTLNKIDPSISEKYFKERPTGNKISAWISPQSTAIEGKKVLEENYKYFENKYAGKEIPYPVFWGGYCLIANKFEFWQGQANRLHDRILYDLNEESQDWKIIRLAP